MPKRIDRAHHTLRHLGDRLAGFMHRPAASLRGVRDRAIGGIDALHIAGELSHPDALQQAACGEIIDGAVQLSRIATQFAGLSGNLVERPAVGGIIRLIRPEIIFGADRSTYQPLSFVRRRATA